MAAKKLKVAGANIPIPQDDSEARTAIREIGDANRAILRLEAEMNDKIALLQQEYGEKVAPLREAVTIKTDGLKMFCEVNRERLTGGKVKFARFATGQVSWRTRPAKVSIRGMDEVLAAIKAVGMGKKFIRVKEEVNKEAMLEDRKTASMIKGVSIGSEGEDFIVEPFETELQEAV